MQKTKISREEKMALYNKMVTSHPEAVLKGDTIPYTSQNGHMQSMLTKGDEIALRLPEKERTIFIEKYQTRLLEQYGVVQKEYVVVPDSILQETDELKKYFYLSYQYVSALKPKPTTKSKKKQ